MIQGGRCDYSGCRCYSYRILIGRCRLSVQEAWLGISQTTVSWLLMNTAHQSTAEAKKSVASHQSQHTGPFLAGRTT